MNLLDDTTCADAMARLYEYLDHELLPHERTAVEQHLAACEGCRYHYEFDARLLDRIRDQCRTERAPVSIRRRVDRLLASL
jgi:anti-sigma factor (TIGR02949 family)